MIKYALAIDLGTTFSKVSIAQKDRNELVEDADSSKFIPSMINFCKKDDEISIIVGFVAKKRQLAFPKMTIYDTKRMLGRKFDDENIEELKKSWPFQIQKSESGGILVSIPGVEKKYQPYELSGEILKYLVSNGNKRFSENERTNKVIITIPANFGDEQRTETMKAAKYAGLEVLQLINEPTAAGLAFSNNNVHLDDGYIFIFDFGGGTLDVSLLYKEGTSTKVLGTDGDMFLGGRDFDENLVNYVIEELHLGEKFRKNSKKMSKLLEAVIDAKIILSKSSETTIYLTDIVGNNDDDDNEISIDLSLKKFEEINDDLIKRTLIPVQRIFESTKIDKKNIDRIIPVGGSSNMQFVNRKLKEFFGKQPYAGINPQEAVAVGAAIVASNYINPSQKIEYQDICPISIGTSDVYERMNVLIPKGQKIPFSVTENYKTIYYRQDTFLVDIYEGENDCIYDNNYLGEFSILNLPQSENAIYFDVTFSIDENGILSASAKLTNGDLHAETQIHVQKIYSCVNHCKKSKKRDLNTIECEIFLRNIQRFINFNMKSLLKIYSQSYIDQILCNVEDTLENIEEENIDISFLLENYEFHILSQYFKIYPVPGFFR